MPILIVLQFAVRYSIDRLCREIVSLNASFPLICMSFGQPSCNIIQNGLDVATAAVAMTRVRSARAAGVVTMTGAVNFALDDDAVPAVAVVVGDK